MKKGQSVLEYTILIATVAAAFMAMQVYLNRAVNAKLHDLELETSPSIFVQQDQPD